MNMFEEARSLAVMMKMRSLSQSETAKMLGVSQSYIANKLRLLKIDEKMQKQILSSGLTERHARALLRLKTEKERQFALDKICAQNLSVAEAGALVDFLHTSEISHMIGNADKLYCVNKFIDSIRNGADTLSSFGIKNHTKISYHASKLFITICIEENG